MWKVIDHVALAVSDLERSRLFYARALAPLGLRELGPWSEERREVAFGPYKGAGDFAISDLYERGGTVHVAFRASSREAVHAFYEAALAAGARDNGAPGFRPQYAEGYYSAFVLDPDAHNLEAVWQAPRHNHRGD
jgi:catechol 2,3-dioxygenase-like lactoylglutathione lyase family enzyme